MVAPQQLHLLPGDPLPPWFYFQFLQDLSLVYRECEQLSRSEHPLYGFYQKILDMLTIHIRPHSQGAFVSYGQRRMDSDEAFEAHSNVKKYLVVIPDFALLHLLPGPNREIQQRHCKMLVEIKRHTLPSPTSGNYIPYAWLTEHSSPAFTDTIKESLCQIILQAFVAFHTFPDPTICLTVIAGAHFALFEFKRPDVLAALPQEPVRAQGDSSTSDPPGDEDPDYIKRNKIDFVVVSGFIPRNCVEVLIYGEPTVDHWHTGAGAGLSGISAAFIKCFLTSLPTDVGIRDDPSFRLNSDCITNFASKPEEIRWGEMLLDKFYRDAAREEDVRMTSDDPHDQSFSSVSEGRSELLDPSYIPGPSERIHSVDNFDGSWQRVSRRKRRNTRQKPQ